MQKTGLSIQFFVHCQPLVEHRLSHHISRGGLKRFKRNSQEGTIFFKVSAVVIKNVAHSSNVLKEKSDTGFNTKTWGGGEIVTEQNICRWTLELCLSYATVQYLDADL